MRAYKRNKYVSSKNVTSFLICCVLKATVMLTNMYTVGCRHHGNVVLFTKTSLTNLHNLHMCTTTQIKMATSKKKKPFHLLHFALFFFLNIFFHRDQENGGCGHLITTRELMCSWCVDSTWGQLFDGSAQSLAFTLRWQNMCFYLYRTTLQLFSIVSHCIESQCWIKL